MNAKPSLWGLFACLATSRRRSCGGHLDSMRPLYSWGERQGVKSEHTTAADPIQDLPFRSRARRNAVDPLTMRGETQARALCGACLRLGTQTMPHILARTAELPAKTPTGGQPFEGARRTGSASARKCRSRGATGLMRLGMMRLGRPDLMGGDRERETWGPPTARESGRATEVQRRGMGGGAGSSGEWLDPRPVRRSRQPTTQ